MIREYQPSDLAAIEQMHNGNGFVMPQLDHPLMIVRKCMVDEDDVPRLAAFGRLHINALLFVDHHWKTPAERLEALKELQTNMLEEGRSHGLDIATTQMEGRFAERMKDLGWSPAWGELYYHDL